jgi:hypothetical protein
MSAHIDAYEALSARSVASGSNVYTTWLLMRKVCNVDAIVVIMLCSIFDHI